MKKIFFATMCVITSFLCPMEGHNLNLNLSPRKSRSNSDAISIPLYKNRPRRVNSNPTPKINPEVIKKRVQSQSFEFSQEFMNSEFGRHENVTKNTFKKETT